MVKKLCATIFAVAILGFLKASPAAAQSFFEGKTIRIIVGLSAGGGFDTYSRTIARHLGRHIPGNPSVIVENMPGAGSLIAANHVYRIAKPDGLAIGNFHGYMILNQVAERPGIEFDARKFGWIGVPVSDTGACALTAASGVTSLDQWKAAKTPVKLGAVGGGGDATYTQAKFLRDILNLPVQIVTGYKGTAEVRLASEAGELAGGCWQWESIKSIWRKALDAREVNVVLQLTPEPHNELPKVPLAISLAKTEEARTLLRAAVHDPNAITRPYSLPPGTPADRVQVLRKAFMATMQDPAFLADANKAKLDIKPMSGEELEKIVSGFFQVDPAILPKLQAIFR
jgi:tripartite-type tricarboxylate transporter receptor subunit TctC